MLHRYLVQVEVRLLEPHPGDSLADQQKVVLMDAAKQKDKILRTIDMHSMSEYVEDKHVVMIGIVLLIHKKPAERHALLETKLEARRVKTSWVELGEHFPWAFAFEDGEQVV